MRLIIAGGGTGGHLFPGIAIAEEFKRRNAGNELLFVGTERGIEARALPELGWSLRFISAEGVKGKGILAGIRAALKLMPGLLESLRIIRGFKPDAVIGVGGYASAPVLAAARISGIRAAVHEQNALPGLTNRVMGKVVNRIFVSFPESAGFFPERRVTLSGNPLRKEISEGLKHSVSSRQSGKKTILIFGGSLGAHRINTAALEMIKHLQPSPSGRGSEGGGFRIIHQTGDRDYKEIKEGYMEAEWQADVRPFIYDMASAYREADLVVCRAGATTISELAAAGKPAILIPYPYAADGHQRVNAEALVKAGGAVMILERDLTGVGLATEIRRLFDDGEILRDMGERARGLARVDAAKVVVDGIYDLIKGRGGVTPPLQE